MLLIIPYKTSLTPAICNMLIFKIDYHLSPSRVCNIIMCHRKDCI